MNKLWHELKNMDIPLIEVGAIIAISFTAYIWADDLGDAQKETQKQLDQLVTITVKTTKENALVHKKFSESLTSIQTALELIAQEIRLRREFERENPIN